MGRLGNPRSGLEQVGFRADARSLDRGSPATNLGHAVTNPRIRARSTVVHASCRPHWAPINSTAEADEDARLGLDITDIRARKSQRDEDIG